MKNELLALLEKQSKHSRYQAIPTLLEKRLNIKSNPKINRFDQERFKYISDQIDFEGKKVLDIGGNAGYFTFESLSAGAVEADIVEGNHDHCEYVKSIAKILNLNIQVLNEYYDHTKNQINKKYDIIFILNVIHHLGDDFGNKNIKLDSEEFHNNICNMINYLFDKTTYLVLQMGFNWKGNINCPIFKNGSKIEMIEYIKTISQKNWFLEKVGIAEENKRKTTYVQLNDKNNIRIDSLGEFRNRPIFILKSKYEF